MAIESSLTALAETLVPSDDRAARMRAVVLRRVKAGTLSSLAATVHPDPSSAQTIKDRIFQRIQPSIGHDLSLLASNVVAPQLPRESRNTVLARLSQSPRPFIHTGLKWAAAFALVLLAVRSLPLLLLAPSTHAGAGVQLLPVGDDIAVYVGGLWRPVTTPEVLRDSVMIRTGENSHATVIVSDQGVIRLSANAAVRFNALTDRAPTASQEPAATLVRGRIWALGLLPSVSDGIDIRTSFGTLSLNTGSVSADQQDDRTVVDVYDRGATFREGKQTAFLVTGERVVARGTPFSISGTPPAIAQSRWAIDNLSQDATHRTEIAKLQEKSRKQSAGILPTSSFLFAAKRMAEEVDYFFTLTQDGRTEKRIQQANTRLNEALTLLSQGNDQAASGSILAYRDSLVALAGEKDDNIVKELIRNQIEEASASLNSPETDAANVALLKDAIAQVSDVIPDAHVSQKDVEGYLLVDRLANVKKVLATEKDVATAAKVYGEIRPYLSTLLGTEDGMHPLLKKEATALLASTATMLKGMETDEVNTAVRALETDIAQYLPPEPESLALSEEAVDKQIKEILARIFIFRSPRSRYNQLQQEMQSITGPRRGMILRRLKEALPEGLGGYVQTEIKELGDELRGEGR